ncbi:MAG: hypothetical protein J6X40_00245 [Bacteroidales bacterium]|jgi:tetratricopeptide (TPR) repeat protein|nr:hypothetical protein [Bacteroidales bacterium]
MKRPLILTFWLLFAASALAQTQQGYVRTIGRPDQPGSSLEGVVIQAQGMVNAVVSDSTGRFSISIPGKKDGDPIALLSIRKKGYELKDKELKGRNLVCSSRVPLHILMVDQRQLEADRRRIEENAYRVAEENYQKRLDVLEQQKEANDITIEQYRQELQTLEDNYDRYLSLIDDMADRYARTDYDQLDSIDYQINLCIENGDLDKADSLIHTVFDPETVLERNRAAKQEIQERIALAQSIIDKANADKAAILQDLEYAQRLANLCDNLAQEYVAAGKADMALQCLEKSLEIKRILYGETHPSVEETQLQINALRL